MTTETTDLARIAHMAYWTALLGQDPDVPALADEDPETGEAWEASASAVADQAARRVYRERARLTAFLAACYPSSLAQDQDDPDYKILYVTTPAGQMSWHVHAGDAAELLGHVPVDESAGWDGHTTEAKYARLTEMTGRVHLAGGLAGVVASTARPAVTTAPEAGSYRDQAVRHLAAGRDAAHDERDQASRAGNRPSVTGYGPHADALRLEHERDEARAVVREMGTVLAAFGEGPDQIAQWCQRAGMGGES